MTPTPTASWQAQGALLGCSGAPALVPPAHFPSFPLPTAAPSGSCFPKEAGTGLWSALTALPGIRAGCGQQSAPCATAPPGDGWAMEFRDPGSLIPSPRVGDYIPSEILLPACRVGIMMVIWPWSAADCDSDGLSLPRSRQRIPTPRIGAGTDRQLNFSGRRISAAVSQLLAGAGGWMRQGSGTGQLRGRDETGSWCRGKRAPN